MPILDEPSPVRPDATFDLAALGSWLRGQGEGLSGEPELRQFVRGYSNLTYLVRFGERELVLRRAPPGVHIKSAHDMRREFSILRALAPRWSKVPRPIALCDDPAVIGTPFYVMDRVAGVVLRERLPAGLTLDETRMRTVAEAACDTLAEIHRIDWRAAGLGDLGKPDGYVERQLDGWADRWRKARTDDVPAMERLGAWLEARRRPESGATLIHNDFKYDNLVLAPELSRVAAVLDWEMATIGDPLMDLGSALGYWIQADDPPILQAKVFGPTNLAGNLTRVQFVERWSQATGREAKDVLFYYAFALFKLAVVAQQLYKRWVDGVTRDPRFELMLHGVRALAAGALVAVEKGRIDRLAD